MLARPRRTLVACGVLKTAMAPARKFAIPTFSPPSALSSTGVHHPCEGSTSVQYDKRIVEARQLPDPNPHFPHSGESDEFKLSEESRRRIGSIRGWSAGMEIDIEAASSTD